MMLNKSGMKNWIRDLWKDQSGTIELSSWFALVVMVVMGSLVGLSNLRMEITQQFGDVAQALDAIDQSYSYTVNNVTSTYADTSIFSAPTPGTEPAGLDVTYPGAPE